MLYQFLRWMSYGGNLLLEEFFMLDPTIKFYNPLPNYLFLRRLCQVPKCLQRSISLYGRWHWVEF